MGESWIATTIGKPTEVVESARGQPLWQVGRKKETGEEGKEEVVTVAGQGLGVTAPTSAAKQ